MASSAQIFFVLLLCLSRLRGTKIPVVKLKFKLSSMSVRKGVATATSFPHLGDGDGSSDGSFVDDVGEREKRAFHKNLGQAINAIQRGLPLVFQDQSGMDFSIFAPVVTVMVDGMVLPLHKSMYIAGVRSFRVAALFSAAEPSMCLRKVEYLESFRTIQCLVDVLLPHTVPLGDGGGRGVGGGGRTRWKGVFYFGLDKHGLVDSHVVSRVVPPFLPEAYAGQYATAAASLPWLKVGPTCSADLVAANACAPPCPPPSRPPQ